jgi:predicted Zn finger-like uncharacterized protein
MSLATRCTSCGTVFRVVQDQLKVSEGWVRCGRCDAVFNALEGLFDLEREPPPAWTAADRAAAAGPTEFRVEGHGEPEELDEVSDPELVDRIDEQIFGSRRSAFGALASLATPERKHPDFADARFDTDVPIDALEQSTQPTESVLRLDSDAPDNRAAPEFVREAEQKERWQSSGARKALASGVFALIVLLAGQAAHQFRDVLAVRWPASQPALAAWCGLAGCTIEPPRRIEDIVVESTALARAATADAFKLSVGLRNRAPTPALMPWVELSLTDASGQLVARRALAPADFRQHDVSLAASGEATLQAQLSTGAARVTGYTVEIFYP